MIKKIEKYTLDMMFFHVFLASSTSLAQLYVVRLNFK